jgi:hypothetical protein
MGSYNFIEGSYVEYFLSNSKEDSSNSNVNDVSDQDKKPAAKRASNVNDVSDQDKKPAAKRAFKDITKFFTKS